MNHTCKKSDLKYITLTEALQQLEHTGGQLVHIYAVVRDSTAAHKSGGSDYTCTLYLEDPTSKEVPKVEMVCFARSVNLLPADPEGSLQLMKAKPGDIIRLFGVRIQWYGSEDKKKPQKPQILMQVRCPAVGWRQGRWSLFSLHPPPEGVPEAPYASSSVSDTYSCSENDLQHIRSLRAALCEPLDQATAQQQQQQQQQQQEQQQQQQQDQQSRQDELQVPLQPQPPQLPPQQQQEYIPVCPSQPTQLIKLEGLVGSCEAPERSLVDVICKVLAVDYRDAEHAVLYVWDATDALPCSLLNIPPCVTNIDAAASFWPLWKRQLHAMPLCSMPPPVAASTCIPSGCGAPPSWKGGADVVPPWQVPRLGTAVPVVVPLSVTAPPLLCCDRGVPISAGVEVKLKKVSSCIVQGQAQLLVTSCSRCTIRESSEDVGRGGQEKAGQKRGQQQQQQQGNKKARTAKLGIADVYESRRAQQRQEWEQLGLQQQQQQQCPGRRSKDPPLEHTQEQDNSDLQDGPSGWDKHLATRVLLPPGYSGPPPRRGTVRDVLMAFMDAERDATKAEGAHVAAPSEAARDGVALQGSQEVPSFVVVARISAHHPHASQAAALLRSEIPDPGLPEEEWGRCSKAHLFKILIEDATGQLDAAVVGADVESFFGPLIPSQKWASNEQGDVQVRTDLMESGFRWLESGIPSAHIGVSSREREEIHLSRLAKQRGGKKVGSGRGRGTGRGGGWGGSSSSRPTGCAFPDKSSQQPWCEVLIHPFVWDDRVRGMQFYRVSHTTLTCPAHVTASLQLPWPTL